MKTNFDIQKTVRNSRIISAMRVFRHVHCLGLTVCALLLGSLQVWGSTTKTYVFTSKSWAAICDGSGAANWTSGKDGTALLNNGIQVTTTTTEANGTSPMEFRNISQIVVRFNTNKSAGAGNIKIKVGSNDEVSNAVAYSGSADGTSQYFSTTFNFSPAQSGSVKLTTTTSTNSLYIVSIAITYDPVAYTVTYDAEAGTCGTSSETEGSGGAGVTLPSATPSVAGWEFAGWAKSTCAETEVAPRLYRSGSTYKPEANETLHAVYRKMTDGSSTSTATFTASTQSGLTIIGKKYYTNYRWIHTASGVEFNISDYGIYSNTFNLDNRDSKGKALISAYRRIKQVVFTASEASYLIDNVTADAGSAELSTSSTTQTVTCDGAVTQLLLSTDDETSSEARITAFTVTYYDTKFNSNPCGNVVSLSKGTQTNATISSFSPDNVETCSSTDADRQVTVTVAAATGYEFLSTARLTFAKTSGTATATYVSGPTGTGPYTWVYQFAKDDSGAGTFSVTSATPKSYTVTLNDNTGSGGSGSKTVTFNANTNMTSAVTIPTKTHYIFGGYWTSSDAGTTLTTQIIDENGDWKASVSGYTDDTPNWIYAGDVTLYAKWTEHTYTNYRTVCCPTIVQLGHNSPAHGTVAFARAKVPTCDDDQNVTMTITPDAGYKLKTWAVATGDGKVDASSTSPAVITDDDDIGEQEISLTFDQHTSGTYAVTATFEQMKDQYYDYMHDNAKVGGDRTGAYSAPTRTSKTAGKTDNDCKGNHYKFKGWVVSSEVNDDGTLKDGYTLISGGASMTASNKIYYAIWAEEE